ncbi:hydroxyacylglutathione hydrolase-like protein [Notechis scutatus]|uniref:Hydroxyacylglutathione hydrolase-like protein n=1 Tax=Notechis scutatus TaxID=8663 RepID=A0A6J1VL36_9SAUR|nr:hydroxyacylglutathione hydrolase-like protein [Notechis scutatus]
MKVKVISILEDNYMYLIIEETTREAVAVDAAVSKRLLEIIRREDIILKAILTTHHHWDHARDNEELAKLYPGLEVYGGDERVGALTHRVTHEQELKVSMEWITPFAVPQDGLVEWCGGLEGGALSPPSQEAATIDRHLECS